MFLVLASTTVCGSDTDSRVNSLQSELRTSRREIAELREQIKSLEETTSALQRSLASVEAQGSTLEHKQRQSETTLRGACAAAHDYAIFGTNITISSDPMRLNRTPQNFAAALHEGMLC
ncbi:MAG TPA: hypothetical protein VGR87_10770 [Candidatus Limnocylindria bacterium]|nr:hypothetical protein [Candidatus Limnocylindria bacterium]